VTFDIPNHAQVQIFVGENLALPPFAGVAQTVEPRSESRPSRGRPLLKTIGVAALVVTAFVVGQHFSMRPVGIDLASSAGTAPAEVRLSSSEPQAFADGPLPSPAPAPAAAPDQIPAAFAQQLQQAPAIAPPPGAPPGGTASSKHAFGLDN
jgi:hypothetical protein